jgi:hypothetical protein
VLQTDSARQLRARFVALTVDDEVTRDGEGARYSEGLDVGECVTLPDPSSRRLGRGTTALKGGA